MNAPTQTSLLVVVVVCLVLLTACDSVLQVGVMPTATPAPGPTPVLGTYANDEYGFAFRYGSTWTLTEEPNAVRLNRGTRNVYIGYRWAAEPANIWGRTGAPAGDLIYGGKVFFLNQVIQVRILEYQRKDKGVFYGESGLVEAGDLVFVLYLDDTDGAHYDQLDLPKGLQAEVQDILESFTRIEATGAPPTASPTPPAVEMANVYSSDDLGFSFAYGASWTLDEIPGQTMENGVKCADALVLSWDTVAVTIQHMRISECCEQVAWCGEGMIVEPTKSGTTAFMGRNAFRSVMADREAVKAVDISYSDQDIDLGLMITLRDTSSQGYTAAERTTISESVLVEFEQIVASFQSR